MDVEKLRAICLKLPGTTEDLKWGDNLCFCVGTKLYLIVSLDETPVAASFKVADEEFEAWSQREGFKPAPYLARNKWVKTDDIARLTAAEWKERSRNAYDIIKAKLPAKLRRQLD